MTDYMRALFSRWPSAISTREKILTPLITFVAILVVSQVGQHLVHPYQHLVMVASMGASALLLFVMPNSPLAQPYPFVMGHVVPAAIGVLCANSVDNFYLAAALAVSISLIAMYLLNCLHPPGGAAALVPVIAHSEYVLDLSYVVFPVLINVLTMLLFTLIVHKWILKKEYPVRPMPKKDQRHQHNDPSPLGRMGINSADLQAAMQNFNAYLDITENDLARLYSSAQHNAYVRKFGEIRCSHIMSRDVVTVEYGTDLEEAWALLRLHKVKILPVVDKAHRVIGVISLVDFLKRADLKTYEGFAEKLVAFVRRTRTLNANRPEAVGQIMASPAFTVSEDEFITALVPLLSDRGLHHVPVVNKEQRLVGIVTQSDLIAALYHGAVEMKNALPDA